MNFKCQQSAISELHRLSDKKCHSVMISGVSGSGKTFLARQYSKMLEIEDFVIIEPSVQSVRDAIEASIDSSNPVIMCIENLDTGNVAASYALLKMLEEPKSNIYIVVTCRNYKAVPDTIISRSVCIQLSPPVDSDINEYAEHKDSTKFQIFKTYDIWPSVRSFKDVDTLYATTPEQQNYLINYPNFIFSRDPVSSLQWSMSHYPDNSELPLTLALRYLLDKTKNSYIRKCCISCLNDINDGRVAAHTCLAEFILECKYGGE